MSRSMYGSRATIGVSASSRSPSRSSRSPPMSTMWRSRAAMLRSRAPVGIDVGRVRLGLDNADVDGDNDDFVE